jgi:hypothetical protein
MLRVSLNPSQGDYPAKHIYQAMLSAAPAPKQDELAESSCTAEEAAANDLLSKIKAIHKAWRSDGDDPLGCMWEIDALISPHPTVESPTNE